MTTVINTILSAVLLNILSACLFGCNIQKSNNDAPLENEEQTWTFEDSFESGDVSKWNITVIPTAAVVTNNAYTGSQAFRGIYTFGQPTDNRLEKYFGDHPRAGSGNPDDEIWVRSSHRFPHDFTFSESAGVQKVWIINYEDENGDSVDQLYNMKPTCKKSITHLYE